MISAAQTSTFLAANTYARMSGMAPVLQSQTANPVTVPLADQTVEDTSASDTVTISDRGRAYAQQEGSNTETGTATGDKPVAAEGNQRGKNGQELSAEELKAVQELKTRDREVRTHEQAHMASAGQYAKGGPTYTFQQGPDGRRYAIGGEVPIDVGKEKTPEQTVQKMRAVRSAALAPADPSSADRSIAASASAQEAQARQEMQAEQTKAGQSGQDEAKAASPRQNETKSIGEHTHNRSTRRTISTIA